MRNRNFFVLLITSVALTAAIGAEILGFEPGADRYRLTAEFEDATNLRAGDPVRVSGVVVGRVTKLEVVKGKAKVAFEVDTDVALPEDSSVAVRSQNLLGVRELIVEPGTARTMLASGDEMTNTDSAVDLGALVNELGPFLEAVRPERLNELVGGLNDALDGNRETVQGLTQDFVQVLDTFASRSDTIVQITDDYSVLLAELARRDREIQRLIENIATLAETFAASDQVLIDALDELPEFANRLDSLLLVNGDNLDALLTDLASITNDLRPELDLASSAVAGLPETLESIFVTMNKGEFIDTNFLCVDVTVPPCTAVTDNGLNIGGGGSVLPPVLTDTITGLLSP